MEKQTLEKHKEVLKFIKESITTERTKIQKHVNDSKVSESSIKQK